MYVRRIGLAQVVISIREKCPISTIFFGHYPKEGHTYWRHIQVWYVQCTPVPQGIGIGCQEYPVRNWDLSVKIEFTTLSNPHNTKWYNKNKNKHDSKSSALSNYCQISPFTWSEFIFKKSSKIASFRVSIYYSRCWKIFIFLCDLIEMNLRKIQNNL